MNEKQRNHLMLVEIEKAMNLFEYTTDLFECNEWSFENASPDTIKKYLNEVCQLFQKIQTEVSKELQQHQ